MNHRLFFVVFSTFYCISIKAIWTNESIHESFAKLFIDSKIPSSNNNNNNNNNNDQGMDETDTYQGDLLHHTQHNKAIQHLLNQKGVMRKFPLPSPEEMKQINKESKTHSSSSFRKEVSFTATGYLDNQIYTTKGCSGFVQSSIIFGVGFCVPTSGGAYLLDVTKSYKTITIIINEYLDQGCQYLYRQFQTIQSSKCEVINNAYQTFTYFGSSKVPLQPVDGPEFK